MGGLSRGVVLLFIGACFAVVLQSALAATYTVGDGSGWIIPTNSQFYTSWVSGKIFQVGDELVFNFQNGSHDVIQVTETNYDNCGKTNSLFDESNPPVKISLNTTGPHYYICSYSAHCENGQKVTIPVTASTPSSSPSPSPSIAKTTTPIVYVFSNGSSRTSPSPAAAVAGITTSLPPAAVAVITTSPPPPPPAAVKTTSPPPPPVAVITTSPPPPPPAVKTTSPPPPPPPVKTTSPPPPPVKTTSPPSPVKAVLPGKHRVGGKLKVGVIVGVAVGIGILLIVVVLLTIAFRKRSSPSASKVEKFLLDFIHEMPTRYSYSELKKMTNNFADKLGEGGFGAVYKGKLSKGNLVAVKILDQSKQSESQFMNEVATIGRIHHVHLVRLIGYCFEGFRSALLYEYMANGSLEKFVFVKKENPQMVSWEQLYSIALGAARGIAYLHEECERRIIHFDIKPHNILLDADFTPKVSDFGLAKLCGRLDDHVSITATRGTPGYVAPELWCRNLGPITDKADVYSFGMMLLEIVGGRKNIDTQVSRSSEVYFPDWAFKLLEKGELEERLRGRIEEENETQVVRMCKVGLWCIQYHSRERPSMSRVVEMLEGKGQAVSNPPFPFNSAASPQRLVMSCSQESSSI